MSMSEEQKKQKRVAGELYWKMYDKVLEIQEEGKKIKEWMQDEIKKLNLYADQVDFNTGKVVNDDSQITRLPQSVLEELRTRRVAIDRLSLDLDQLVRNAALRARVYPDMINPKTGEIQAIEIEAVE
jgi:hypothetical protein